MSFIAATFAAIKLQIPIGENLVTKKLKLNLSHIEKNLKLPVLVTSSIVEPPLIDTSCRPKPPFSTVDTPKNTTQWPILDISVQT